MRIVEAFNVLDRLPARSRTPPGLLCLQVAELALLLKFRDTGTSVPLVDIAELTGIGHCQPQALTSGYEHHRAAAGVYAGN